MTTLRFLAVLAVLSGLIPSEAQAHSLRLFVAIEGKTIIGRLYASGTTTRPGITVKVLGPNGALLGETVTQDGGKISFTPTSAIDHRFIADLGDGHRAEALITAGDLSAVLGIPPTALRQGLSEERLTELVSRQIAPLRQEIAEMRHETKIQDIFGALGYVLGAFGLLALWKARKAKDEGADRAD